MPELRQRSIHIILSNQAPGGAFLACPNMPDYRYSWFRDGSYIAYALDLVGEHVAAHRFHDWAAGVIVANAEAVARAETCVAQGIPLDEQAILHTRYTVEGQWGSDWWPNFQLDGIGTWLWAVCDHSRQHTSYHYREHAEPLPAVWREAAGLAARYLAAVWRQPNYDLWEENGDQRHTYTQAAIWGGLTAAAAALNQPNLLQVAEKVWAEIIATAGRLGHFTKFLPGNVPVLQQVHPERSGGIQRSIPAKEEDAVDGALIGVALPHGVVPLDHPAMTRTVALIERDLRVGGGGVHRFAWDAYYGGGEWILLTAWLGWYYAAISQRHRARELLAWIEAQADPRGDLPEQVPQNLIAPIAYQPWVDKRGPIARPLLWSHAQYLILCHALESL